MLSANNRFSGIIRGQHKVCQEWGERKTFQLGGTGGGTSLNGEAGKNCLSKM